MSNWFGLLFFVLLIGGIYIGLKILSRPQKLTGEEFERRAAESASMLNASINALQELLNPESAKAKEVQMQIKEGQYNKRRREGKANGADSSEEKK